MLFSPLLYSVLALFFALVNAAPSVSLISDTQLDPSGVYFVSYDGLVNVNSFQLSGVLTHGTYQYAAWYTSNRYAVLARRQLPSGGWSTLQLSHQLSASDSHNVITLGVSPQDGRIHVALDCHSSRIFYTVSEPGLATSGASWVASRFGGITNNIGNLNVGTSVTYPQFVITPDNRLQFVYRSGVSGNGATQLAEYNSGTWSNVGSWASASGTYTSTNGRTSSARNLYIHGFTYRNNRLHVTGTWREQNGAVSCNSGGLTNHDTTYFYSDDKGRSWRNSAGNSVGTSGSSPVNVNSAGIIVDPLNSDHGLMNQESQDVDSAGQIHAIISYVPGRFGQCVSSYARDRTANGRAFHVYRSPNGTFTKMEIPFALNAVGRSQIVMDNNDNVYVVLPFVKVVTASASSGWTDWTLAFDGVARGLNAFGEVTVDRARVASGVLSVLYQVKSSAGADSGMTELRVRSLSHLLLLLRNIIQCVMAAITPRASGFWEDLTMARGYSNDPESLDASDPDEGPDRRTPLDKTIDRIGMGSYQWTLLSLCGFGWMADNMWIQAVAIILPRIQQHYSVPDNYIGVVSSSLFAGMMIGAVGWGTCSDLLGRIAAFNATLFFTSIFGLAASFANSFTTLCISLFLLGTAVGGSMPTDGTLLLEHMPKNKQYLVTALSVFFSVGAVLSAVVGLLVLPQNSCIPTLPCDPDTQNKGWKYLLISLGLITLTMFLARMVFFRLHESPRYLVHAGRPHDAVRSLQMISRFNGFEMPIELADVSDHLHAVENRQESRTAASNDTDSRTILSDGTGENSPPPPGTSSLGNNSSRKANLATPYASTGDINHGLERHTFQPTRLDHLQNPASSTSHKEGDTDDVHEPLLVNTQRRVDDGNLSSPPVAQGRLSFFGSNTCSTWPGWMRNPLLAWLDRVATVLAPEWLRTTLLVWSAWCAMSLAYTMFNVFLPKLLETRTNGGGTRSLEQSLWDVVIFTIGGCPGALVGAYLIESSVGRRWSLAGSTFLTAFFCLVFAFVSSTWAVRMSTVGISLSATAMWAILYGWTPEIFSTNIRGTACGIASALSRVGGMIAPLLGGILLVISQSLPVYTSVLTFAIAGFCVLLLKENAGESGKRLAVARGVVH